MPLTVPTHQTALPRACLMLTHCGQPLPRACPMPSVTAPSPLALGSLGVSPTLPCRGPSSQPGLTHGDSMTLTPAGPAARPFPPSSSPSPQPPPPPCLTAPDIPTETSCRSSSVFLTQVVGVYPQKHPPKEALWPQGQGRQARTPWGKAAQSGERVADSGVSTTWCVPGAGTL